jgi:hypothetical protein
MILGAVEGDQDVTFESWAFKTWAFEAAQGVETAAFVQRRHGLVEQRMKQAGIDGIEHVADVIVAWNLRHIKQRLAVRAALALEQGTLMRRKRGALQEEDGKRGHADIGHRTMAIEPAPFIRQRGAETAHGVEKRSKPFHASV